jgi:hypothetical protein
MSAPSPPPPPPVEPPIPPAHASQTPPAAPENAYRADAAKLVMVRWLAGFLGLLVAFSVAPAVMHVRLQGSPPWVWIVLLVAAVEGVFLIWLLVTPDWASLRVLMLVFFLAAIGYGAMTVLAINTPPGRPLAWGLEPIRRWVPRWSASVLLISALAAYLCGHFSRKWRRAFDRLFLAAQRPPR